MTTSTTLKLLRTVSVFALALGACGDNLGAPDGGVNQDSGPRDGQMAQAPMVTSTAPSDGATDVALNARLSASFDLAMAPLTSVTFTLMQGGTLIGGDVVNAPDGTTVTFDPNGNLTASTEYTATITTGAMSAEGTALAANHVWMFTTGTTLDTTAPRSTARSPRPARPESRSIRASARRSASQSIH